MKALSVILLLTLSLTQFCSAMPLAGAEEKYRQLLMVDPQEYEHTPELKLVYGELAEKFTDARDYLNRFDYSDTGETINLSFKIFKGSEVSEEVRLLAKRNDEFKKLMTTMLPVLGYAYLTPAPDPEDSRFYKNPEIAELYFKALAYTYSRGVNEKVRVVKFGSVDNPTLEQIQNARGSVGDISSATLHLGGFIQSLFLMQDELEARGLLQRYRGVVRNLVLNNGSLVGTFFEYAEPFVMREAKDAKKSKPYFLNADDIRLFVDYALPYMFMLEEAEEQEEMIKIIHKVIDRNLTVLPGTQDTIKPDGTGYHHHNAYVGGYSPYALEAMAQLLHLLHGSIEVPTSSIEAVKLALNGFREMSYHYTVSNSLSGRLVSPDNVTPSVAVVKAMALMGHPDALNDAEMRGRFKEFFHQDFLYDQRHIAMLYLGKRGIPIRSLGMYGVIQANLSTDSSKLDRPVGSFIKPFAHAGFFHGDGWMAVTKGFSKYIWDFEGPVKKRQNTFGQHWSYGLLEIFTGEDVHAASASGHDIENGYDWYHLPGTTAPHYPVSKFSQKSLSKLRQESGVQLKSLHRNYNDSTFVGGVSLGKNGIFAIDLEATPFDKPVNLKARKTNIHVDGVIVAIGSDISGGTAVDPIHTTLFQTRLQDLQVETGLQGDRVKGELDVAFDSGAVALIDAAGNSYYLKELQDRLVVQRKIQDSLDMEFTPSSGEYATAYLDHGVMPESAGYEYVVLPASRIADDKKELQQYVDGLYRLEQSKGVHALSFPKHGIEAYAFYDLVETPDSMLVASANLHATVMTQVNEGGVDLAVSVPDFGWDAGGMGSDFDSAAKLYDSIESKTHHLELVLRGDWKLTDAAAKVISQSDGTTLLRVECRDGMATRVSLKEK